MALRARYLIGLAEQPPTEDGLRAALARLEGDPHLSKAARDRAFYERDDRWLSVVAGLLIVAMSILYSANLYLFANITAAILCAYVVAMFSFILFKRAGLRRTPPAVSPSRALDALFRGALGLSPRKGDIGRLYDEQSVAAFSRALAEALIPLSKAAGVEPEAWTLNLETDPRLAEAPLPGVAAMPAIATVTAESPAGSVEFILELFASFVTTKGGDSLALDPSPRILGSAAREPRLREDPLSALTWENCPAWGARITQRFKIAKGPGEA
jgi:hypothetical protein